jgi:hypothetical protein
MIRVYIYGEQFQLAVRYGESEIGWVDPFGGEFSREQKERFEDIARAGGDDRHTVHVTFKGEAMPLKTSELPW